MRWNEEGMEEAKCSRQPSEDVIYVKQVEWTKKLATDLLGKRTEQKGHWRNVWTNERISVEAMKVIYEVFSCTSCYMWEWILGDKCTWQKTCGSSCKEVFEIQMEDHKKRQWVMRWIREIQGAETGRNAEQAILRW